MRVMMKMRRSHEQPYGFLLMLLVAVVVFSNPSSSQYNSPRNIETYCNPYLLPASPPAPSYKFPPRPAPPPEPGSSSRRKVIITSVGVAAASALVVAALVFLLVSKLQKSRNVGNSNGGGGISVLPAVAATRSRSRTEEVKVDEEGLDVQYWNQLKNPFSTSGCRIRPHPERGKDHDQVNVSQDGGDITEAHLFGTLVTNRDPNAKIFILDPRKSREMTTVVRSLGIPRDKLIDALLQAKGNGKGVNTETLEKLIRTGPTNDEASRILTFSGDPTNLADAESFLYTLLKVSPSAFTQMRFSLNFQSDILAQVKEPLRTLESACDDLRSRDTFLKLLQAVHNAAARLASTKPAFKLSSLRELCDYKSSDGKTTLLHFVVHQMVRNEGRRCVLTRKSNISGHNHPHQEVDKESEFLKLGLPVVGGLSSEFPNSNIAADFDYHALMASLASLVNRIREARVLATSDDSGFLEMAELEAKAAQLEHTTVINLVKTTTHYFQAGDSSSIDLNNPLQLFVIVKDFLSMIDQACLEIARNLQHNSAPSPSDSSQPDMLTTRVNFPRLPPQFFSDTPTRLGDDA